MYAKHKTDFIKLTIRCDKEDLDRFKTVCKILGLSANNQINIMIKKFNYENKNLLGSTSSFSASQNISISEFWDKQKIEK